MRSLLIRALNSKIVWVVLRQARKIWVRAVGFAFLALLTAISAQYFGHYLPKEWGEQFGADSVDQVLNILATSMLAVTTFSLSIAVSAFSSAASSATPRATALLQEDHTTQNVLATFLGAFLFSLVGIVALKAGYYSQSGRLVLFAATALVITFVVGALLRWISHLTVFGRIDDTLKRVEKTAAASLARRMETPWLGGKPQSDPPPDGTQTVCATTTGYVQHIDVDALNDAAERLDADIWITALPGSFAHPTRPLVRVRGRELTDEDRDLLRGVFTCDHDRTFDQDPRFGLIVMAEIASRALSPAVNDQGTAIKVIGGLVGILSPWRSDVEPQIDYPRVIVPSLRASDMLEDAFRPIARDGAGKVEVQVRLQKALGLLAATDSKTFGSAAAELSGRALERARHADLPDDELTEIEAAAALVRS